MKIFSFVIVALFLMCTVLFGIIIYNCKLISKLQYRWRLWWWFILFDEAIVDMNFMEEFLENKLQNVYKSAITMDNAF